MSHVICLYYTSINNIPWLNTSKLFNSVPKGPRSHEDDVDWSC